MCRLMSISVNEDDEEGDAIVKGQQDNKQKYE